jgi:hypothetical protein
VGLGGILCHVGDGLVFGMPDGASRCADCWMISVSGLFYVVSGIMSGIVSGIISSIISHLSSFIFHLSSFISHLSSLISHLSSLISSIIYSSIIYIVVGIP